jgi:2,4-dichlorophenol 6-monooxygenase
MFVTRSSASRNLFVRFASSAAFAPVVIVGGGPVGSYLSALLTQHQVRSVVLESERGPLARYDDPSLPKPHPKAHVLHTRSVELLRLLGMEDEVKKATPPQEHWKHFLYCPRLLGETFAYVNHLDSPEARSIQDASPCRLVNFSQPKLDELLAHKAMCSGVDVASKVLYQHTFLDADVQTNSTIADGCDITVRFKNKRSGSIEKIRCGFLVAADGAYSAVRTQMGVRMVGQRNLESFLSVHFTCKELTRRLLESNKAAMLSFVFNGTTSTVFVAHDLSRGELVVHIPFFPPHQKATDFDHERVRQILSDCIGQELEPNAPLGVRMTGRQYMPWTLHSMRPWSMHATSVEDMSAFDDRVFFVGDAAHQFPPSGGFGLNIGLVDAHNLAWKLAAVHHGTAPHALLRTYSEERLPVVHNALRLALQNYRRGLLIADTLGLSRAALDALVQGMDAPLSKLLLSREARNSLLRASFKVGELRSSSAEYDRHVENLEKIVCQQRKALPMVFPLNDLGYVYRGTNEDKNDHCPPPQESFIPRAQVGGLLPHAWLREVGTDVRLSTVDIAARCMCPETGVPRFALIMDGGAAERHWCDNPSWRDVRQLVVPVVVDTTSSSTVALNTAVAVQGATTIDQSLRFEFDTSVEAFEWVERRIISPDGALLVRPDGHILCMWHESAECPANWPDFLRAHDMFRGKHELLSKTPTCNRIAHRQ